MRSNLIKSNLKNTLFHPQFKINMPCMFCLHEIKYKNFSTAIFLQANFFLTFIFHRQNKFFYSLMFVRFVLIKFVFLCYFFLYMLRKKRDEKFLFNIITKQFVFFFIWYGFFLFHQFLMLFDRCFLQMPFQLTKTFPE